MCATRWDSCNCHVRASDTDREATVSVLRDAYAAGRLTIDEIRQRAGVAYSAATWGELRVLTADIPAPACCTRPGRPEIPGKAVRGNVVCALAVGWLMSVAFLAVVSAAAWGSAGAILLLGMLVQLFFVACWITPSPGRPGGMARSCCPAHGGAIPACPRSGSQPS